MSKPYCPQCGETMEETSQGQVMYQGYGAFTCPVCDGSRDCPPDDEDEQIPPMYDEGEPA